MYDRVLGTPQRLIWFASTDIPYLTQTAYQRKLLLGVKEVEIVELVRKCQMRDIRVEPIFTEWMDQHGVENQKNLFADSKYMSSQ